MLYDVRITEILERIVQVEANDPNEAESITKQMYHDEEIVLDYSDMNGNAEIICMGQS